jgi:Fe-S-cluster containining protein
MSTDAEFIQIVDAKMAEAARLSGKWLKCRPGCTQCCYGPFEITPLDASRLRKGMSLVDVGTAGNVQRRAQEYMKGYKPNKYDDKPCPALNPDTGRCDLYEWRPITCRTFGPPALNEGGALSVCELCFDGATDEEIAACYVDPDPDGLEAELLAKKSSNGFTIVAKALVY